MKPFLTIFLGPSGGRNQEGTGASIGSCGKQSLKWKLIGTMVVCCCCFWPPFLVARKPLVLYTVLDTVDLCGLAAVCVLK